MLRYSLVLILGWIGLFEFTPTEAAGIQPLFTHNPLFAWLYDVLSVRAVSNLVGSAEILVALRLALRVALRPVSPRLSYFWGHLGRVVVLSLFTTD